MLFGLYSVYLSAAIAEFAISPQAILVLVLFTTAFLVKRKGVGWLKDRLGIWLAGLCLFIETYHYISTGVFTIGSLKFFALIIMIYHLVNQFGRHFTDSLFKVMYSMTLVTIPFYIFQIVDVNLLSALLEPFNFSVTSQSDLGGTYVFFFNLNPWQPDRNSGFMWEAGAFGAMIVFLLVYRYIFIDRMSITKTSMFLFAYAATTISTTTYMALFFCLFFLALQRNRKNVLKLSVYLGVTILLVIPIYNSPFMKGKIDKYLDQNVDYNQIYQNREYTEANSSASIGRFAGLLIEVDRVKNRPILGYGWDDDYEVVGIGNVWSNPNGLAVLLGKFGLLGITLILYGLNGFIPNHGSRRKLESLMIAIVIVLPLFSNPFQYNIVIWTMIMIGWVNIKNRRRHQLQEVI